MKRTFYYISLFALIFVLGCVSPKPLENENKSETETETAKQISQTIYATANMNEITIKKGEHFEITLDSNPTTGFSWMLAEDLDASMIEEIDNVYGSKASDNDKNPPLVGAGGIETWTFKALATGESTIKMKYCQPFDASNPVEEKTILVKIQ